MLHSFAQHRQELDHLRPPSAEEVKHLVEREVCREKERTEMVVTQLKER